MLPTAIIIPVWNGWEVTRTCLDALEPCLMAWRQAGHVIDVVIVDDGSTDPTRNKLPKVAQQLREVHTVRHPENRGFAAACNTGAKLVRDAALPAEVLVFLNNDTYPVGSWLEMLVLPLEQMEGLVATGPRTNLVGHPTSPSEAAQACSGPQAVPEVTYTDIDSLITFEREWRASLGGQMYPTDRLVGHCLAVKRDAFEAVEGFDESLGKGGYEDDDLCLRLIAGGGQLAISNGAYVHHEGHRTFEANGVDVMEYQAAAEALFDAKWTGDEH